MSTKKGPPKISLRKSSAVKEVRLVVQRITKPKERNTVQKDEDEQIKILKYCLKHKAHFIGSEIPKEKSFWDDMAQEIGLKVEQCFNRLRILKQIYMSYVRREMKEGNVTVLWLYYKLCKKVFGYRAIKKELNREKNGNTEDWSHNAIKQLLTHVANNMRNISKNIYNLSYWTALTEKIEKPESECKEKFLDLRKSYRTIKSKILKYPEYEVKWAYFEVFEKIYNEEYVQFVQPMEVDEDLSETEIIDEEDCGHIVTPEDKESELSNTHIITTDYNKRRAPEEEHKYKWKTKTKKHLLKHVYNYIKSRDGKIINVKEMWNDIKTKFPGSKALACHRVYSRLRNQYKKENEDERRINVYAPILKEISALKPKFVRPLYTEEQMVLKERPTYTDVRLPLWQVKKALQYYSDHIEEFVHPKYNHKYSWIDLGKFVGLNTPKLFRKINYLKQYFNNETCEVNGEKIDYADLVKKAIDKECALKKRIANEPKPDMEEEIVNELPWSDKETKKLLKWYLKNLEKFKNPKYVSSYLWMEASKVFKRSAVSCSNRMTEIQSQ